MGLNRFSSLAVIMMIFAMVLSESWWSCHGCLEEERSALLLIKSCFINYPSGTFMQSWGKVANCCTWEGAECNFTTGRVVSLYLSFTRLGGLGDWYLNVSLFRPFQELKFLYLRGNDIVGCVENEGFERLSRLDSLEFLDLGDNKFDNSILATLGGLSSLRTLYLDDNKLKGAISVDGNGDELLRLGNLEHLYLDSNQFNNSILSSLKDLSSLKSLNIGYNQLKGSINVTELDALINLEMVSLSGNEIDKFVFSKDTRGFGNISSISLCNNHSNGRAISFSLLRSLSKFPNLRSLYLGGYTFEESFESMALASLTNLEELDLSYSTLNNNFLQTVGKICSNFYWNVTVQVSMTTLITTLKSLSLLSCGLNGSIPQGLCQLKHLQKLYIGDNDLNGVLPWCLANLTSLQNLDLSSNLFVGDISLSPLTSLKAIQELFLLDNHFQIPVSLSPFFNHSQLKYFYGWDNEMYVEELEEHNLIPKFQLEILDLSGQVSGGSFPFPKFMFYQYNLRSISFSNMKMRGGFPNWLLENNTHIEALVMVNNSLSGPLQLPVHPLVNLSTLDISNNYLDGHIPVEIGAYFPSLIFLSMSKNHFSGSIPSSFGDISSLQLLDLSKNIFSGTLPSFSSNLLHVYLSRNMLQGSLEYSFQNSSELITLDLSHNHLTGSIPKWIGEIFQLNFLLLGYNNLNDRIPIQLCKLDRLSYIDLSHNYFSGHILPCLRFRSSIWFIQVNNYPSGYTLQEPLELATKSMSYYYAPSILYYVAGIDLSCNNLNGEIPPKIKNFDHIQVLNLSNNHLIGPIPQTFANLSEVESLDLSNNMLNGEIPPQLIQLHSLSYFSVAHNNLSGKTPEMVAQFSTFNKSSYEGNPLLCGPPLLKSCTKEVPSPPPGYSSDDKEGNNIIDVEVFYVSFVVTYIMVLLVIAAVLYINTCWRRAWFYFIEKSINICYYFVVDNFLKHFGIRGWKPFV